MVMVALAIRTKLKQCGSEIGRWRPFMGTQPGSRVVFRVRGVSDVRGVRAELRALSEGVGACAERLLGSSDPLFCHGPRRVDGPVSRTASLLVSRLFAPRFYEVVLP